MLLSADRIGFESVFCFVYTFLRFGVAHIPREVRLIWHILFFGIFPFIRS